MLPPWSTACCLWFALLAHVLLILCGARLAALFVMLSAADSEVEFKSKEVNAEALQETAHAKAARNQLEKTLRYGAAFGVLCTSIKMGSRFGVGSFPLQRHRRRYCRCPTTHHVV